MTAPTVTTMIGAHNTHSTARRRRCHSTTTPPAAAISVG